MAGMSSRPNFSLGGQLVPQGKAQDQHPAYGLPQGQRLPQHRYRDQDRHQGIDVAENGGLLPRNAPQSREVEAVGQARVDESHRQKAGPAHPVHTSEVDAVGEQDVGKQDGRGGQELEQGAVKPLHPLDELVEDHRRGVQHRRPQGEEDARQVVTVPRPHACDQHDAQGGHDEADHLLEGQLFLEEEGADQGDQHGGEVVAQGGYRHGGALVGLEEEDPVDTDGNPRGQKQGDMAADGGKGDPLAGDEQDQQDHRRGHDGAVQGQLPRGHGNEPHEGGQGAEDGHGGDEEEAGLGIFHGGLLGMGWLYYSALWGDCQWGPITPKAVYIINTNQAAGNFSPAGDDLPSLRLG